MIEIVCPSCDARYQLPDGSIGPDGRNVSCSNCAHKWRAHAGGGGSQAASQAPSQPASQAPSQTASQTASQPASQTATQPSAAPSAPAQPSHKPSPATAVRPSSGVSGPSALDPADAAAVAAAMAVAGSGTSGHGSGATTPAPSTGDREQQMDAIRKMLADLKDGAEAADAAVPEPVTKPKSDSPAQPVRRRDSEEDERDTLKSRIDDLTKMGKAAKGEAAQSGYNTQKLRKLHEKRAKKLQKARERRGKSGAFTTGFLLVAMVALTMVGLYVMKPQIVAASPGMGPAMDEYVVTVDRYRVELNETTSEWRGWVTERIAKLRGEEAEDQAPQTQ